MKKTLCIFSLCLMFSCDNDSSLLINPISSTKYYQNEILTDQNLKLYGKWQFTYIYDDAGIISGPGKIDPTYDYLEIKKYGIYGKIKHHKVIESGQFEIIRQDDSQFEINFKPDKTDSQTTESQYKVHFTNNNSMELYDSSVGCGFLYHAYKKIK